MGPCAGGASLPGDEDVLSWARRPAPSSRTDVIKTVTGEEGTWRSLAGAMAQQHKSESAHFACDERTRVSRHELPVEIPAPEKTRDTAEGDADGRPESDGSELDLIVPTAPTSPTKRDVVRLIVDARVLRGHDTGTQHRCGFARLEQATPREIVGHQPTSCRRARHRLLEQSCAVRAHVRPFNIPMITFKTSPGFLPGTQPGWGGIIATAEAAVRLHRGGRSRRSP